MNVMTNKALLIGVGLLITIVITSGIIMVISQMKTVYSQVYETDISMSNIFDEFDMYRDESLIRDSIDLLNTAKKYQNKHTVAVKIGGDVSTANVADISSIINELGIKDDIKNLKQDKIKYYTTKVLPGDKDGFTQVIFIPKI